MNEKVALLMERLDVTRKGAERIAKIVETGVEILRTEVFGPVLSVLPVRDLDEAIGGQSRLDHDEVESAVLFHLDPGCPVGGERQRADRNDCHGAVCRFDRDCEAQGETLEPRRRLVDANLQVEVVSVDASRTGSTGHSFDNTPDIYPEGLLIDGDRILELTKVGRQFGSEPAVHALVDVDFWLDRGEWLAIMGV